MRTCRLLGDAMIKNWLRKLVRDDNRQDACLRHRVYGEVLPPWYNLSATMTSAIPDVYNAAGEKLDMYFIRDRHTAHNPYSIDAPPSHWLWDRYNFGLKTHFYSHFEMLHTMGRPDRRFGMFNESRAITPESYGIFDYHPGLEKDFDLIFTYDSNLLEHLDNARFVPFAAAPWYGTENDGGTLDDCVWQKKSKNVSIVSSDKQQCDLHKYRLQLALDCKRDSLADTYGTFDGGDYVKHYADVLTDYRYSIVIENDITPCYFSERLTSAFAAMTIPIYCGADRIADYFNEDGIIKIRPGDDIRKIVAQCSEKDYLSRLPAMQDNFRRALQYRNVWDWMYEKYLWDVK